MNTLPGVLEKPDCRSLKRYLADDPPRLKKYRLASAILELMTGRFRVSVISILGASPVRRRFRLDEGDIERIRGRIGADKGCHGMPSVQHPRKP